MSGRVDAQDKATGTSTYVADIVLPDMCHAAVVRSPEPHARIRGIDISAAKESPGVIGVFTAADLFPGLAGRWTRDIPILAHEKVRYVGERVVAVVASTRAEAEVAASLVYVDYEPLPVITDPEKALADDSIPVHDEPWAYPNSHNKPGEDPINLQAKFAVGNREKAEAALEASAFVIDETYVTQGVHQGYLETQACIASVEPSGQIHLWCTNKSPYMLRSQLADCLEIDPSLISIQAVPIGGDFGGKGSTQDAPLCIELSRVIGRPVKSVLRYSEDLISTNPRHPAIMRVRMGADAEGNLQAVLSEGTVNGGAYLGYKPGDRGMPGGFFQLPTYRIGAFYSSIRSAYTNMVGRSNMRAPGAPQFTFATESALDELAHAVGITPLEIRRRNMLVNGDTNTHGHTWFEYRGHETLDASLAVLHPVTPPDGWLYGIGYGIVAREDHANPFKLSVLVQPLDDGGVEIKVSSVETGTGSHTAMRNLIAEKLGLPLDKVKVGQTSTDDLNEGLATGGSRVTTAFAATAAQVAEKWNERTNNDPFVMEIKTTKDDVPVGTYTVQIAQVAVDPDTGQVKVLDLITGVDIAEVVNEHAFQMQVEGGTVMGYGYACLEDLDESDGQVWAANLGEYKLASGRDVPPMQNVILRGGKGVGDTKVKQIGESTTPAVAAAIANAVFDATGCRIRHLPITSEHVHSELKKLHTHVTT